MLISVLVELAPEKNCVIGNWQGKALHAFLLSQVNEISPETAAKLHDDVGLKPFTVSSIMGGSWGKGEVRLREGEVVRFRITSFEGTLSRLLMAKVLPSITGAGLVLDGTRFEVSGVVADPQAGHEWVGRNRYETLIHSFLEEKRASPVVNLRFASPTAFHSGGNHVPIPIPRLVVESWWRKWNTFAPVALSDEVVSFAEASLVVSRYNLRTVPVRYGQALTVGFVGKCSLRFVRKEPALRRAVRLLAAFSFYAGTGHRTTMGMGQTRFYSRTASEDGRSSR